MKLATNKIIVNFLKACLALGAIIVATTPLIIAANGPKARKMEASISSIIPQSLKYKSPTKTIDVGVATSAQIQRRAEFRLHMEDMAQAISIEHNFKVTVAGVLFATNNDEVKSDAAIVLMESKNGVTGLVFVYNGKWNAFPSDFQ
jgi:dihydroxyacetone kinase-like predicted kinase